MLTTPARPESIHSSHAEGIDRPNTLGVDQECSDTGVTSRDTGENPNAKARIADQNHLADVLNSGYVLNGKSVDVNMQVVDSGSNAWEEGDAPILGFFHVDADITFEGKTYSISFWYCTDYPQYFDSRDEGRMHIGLAGKIDGFMPEDVISEYELALALGIVTTEYEDIYDAYSEEGAADEYVYLLEKELNKSGILQDAHQRVLEEIEGVTP